MPPYLRLYEDPKLNEAYRLYVDGKVDSLGQAAELTGTKKRTLERRSTEATPQCSTTWKAERDQRAQVAAHAAAVAVVETVIPPLGGDGSAIDLEAKLAEALASDDTRTRIGGVLLQQRLVLDEVMKEYAAAFRKTREVAHGRPAGVMAIGQLRVFADVGDRLAAAQRKAHGIPDVTKLEIEDKSEAKQHADVIERRRRERLARVGAATASDAAAGPHGPM